jgi:hypothetical protein
MRVFTNIPFYEPIHTLTDAPHRKQRATTNVPNMNSSRIKRSHLTCHHHLVTMTNVGPKWAIQKALDFCAFK